MAEALAGRRWAALAAAAAALAGGALALNRFLVGVFYDDGLYAGLAIALARGQGYVHLNLPGTPAAVHYPPLYPLVLAPLFGLLPLGAAAFAAKLLNLVLAATAAGLIAWHAERARLLGEGVPIGLAAGVVAVAALAIPVLAVQTALFSEPLFALIIAGAIALADRPPARLGPLAGAALMGGAAALAVLTRSIGVALGAGVVLFALAVRRDPWPRAAAAAAPVVLAALGWGAWVLAHQAGIDPAIALGYGTYGDHLRQAGWSALGQNFFDLPRPLGAIALGWLAHPVASAVIGAAALAVGLYGLALLVRRSAIGLSLVCYLAILAVWPHAPDRFLWAVLPWLALAWTAGVVGLWRTRLRVPVAVVAAAVTIGYGSYEVRGLAGRWWEGAARTISANFQELLPAIAALPDTAVVASDDEALVWLYTGRRAVPLYLWAYRGAETVEPTPAEHRAYLERQGVTHVVLASPSSPSARELRGLIAAHPDWLVPIHRWPGGRWIYEVRRES